MARCTISIIFTNNTQTRYKSKGTKHTHTNTTVPHKDRTKHRTKYTTRTGAAPLPLYSNPPRVLHRAAKKRGGGGGGDQFAHQYSTVVVQYRSQYLGMVISEREPSSAIIGSTCSQGTSTFLVHVFVSSSLQRHVWSAMMTPIAPRCCALRTCKQTKKKVSEQEKRGEQPAREWSEFNEEECNSYTR